MNAVAEVQLAAAEAVRRQATYSPCTMLKLNPWELAQHGHFKLSELAQVFGMPRRKRGSRPKAGGAQLLSSAILS